MSSKLITLCGIIGVWAKNNKGIYQLDSLNKAVNRLKHRGPDVQACKLYSTYGCGHTRLSIIDTDARSNQPFLSADGRYSLVFNGEIYNYKELRKELERKGFVFSSTSDTEVLLNLLILKGKEALNDLDGFFAFAFYDHEKKTLLLARDRMGIKPLLVYQDEDVLLYSSELTGFFDFDINKELDALALNYYFSLTYIPAPLTILKNVKKIQPGHCLLISETEIKEECYYQPKSSSAHFTYEEEKQQVRKELICSVKDRLVADVPLGSFLSGGLDSSIIAALAIQNKPDLKTFSIGFDSEYFNESNYANEVVQKIGSQHTVYKLGKVDFTRNLTDFLASIDEPFADSSAFAMYLLSQKTGQEVKVALSGDGADELAGGYRKHWAEFRLQKMSSIKKTGLRSLAILGKNQAQNRSGKWGDLNRKLQKVSQGIRLSSGERYWNWCQFISNSERKKLLINSVASLKNPYPLAENASLNDLLKADQQLVLPNDMLKKVDSMSMAHGLEVRTPFLAHKFVELMNALPEDYKLNKKGGKQILKDTFGDLLPKSILNRSKKGFEIPLKEWLGEDIKELLSSSLFSSQYIENQGLFKLDYIDQLRTDWEKPNFGDRIYSVWALIVFQHWWNRNLSY